ncbi:hypothetical protein TL16_g12898 [Triparma laevis f. inornata]|uniref:Tetratricopeptide repeat protein n=2 Tax=Triparma laevis TaxID=1534972 RepID=A0A9W7FPS6_9STRA|nr:hypothetical protein TL16_g12898 [Triparma laevis f. inornata]GMI15989.1 hypothetical protein TrLO_g2063 [Triparma laevis f. longispina]
MANSSSKKSTKVDEDDGVVIRLKNVGDGIIHNSDLRHAGVEVREGVRCALVIFIDEKDNRRLEIKEEGLRLKNEGDVDKAIVKFEEYLSLKEDGEGYMFLGTLKLLNGDIDEAIEYGLKSVELSKGDSRTWNNLGLSYKAKGDVNSAISCFKKSIELYELSKKFGVRGGKEGGRGRLNLGLELSWKEEWKETVEVLEGIEEGEEVEERIWEDSRKLIEFCKRKINE